MGEYAMFDGSRIKIGTCEDMYYLRADQAHLVAAVSGSVDPVAERESIRFRFPWPDEDHLEPGAFKDFDRAIHVPGLSVPDGVEHGLIQFRADASYLCSLPCPETFPFVPGLTTIIKDAVVVARNGFGGAVKLVRQKHWNGKLVGIFQCGGCKHLWRAETLEEAQPAIDALRAEAMRSAEGLYGREFYNKIADRLESGYAEIQQPILLGATA